MSNIYVYDKDKYFFLYLKKKLSHKYNFIRLEDVSLMISQNYKKDDMGIFIVNNVNDVVAFFRFRECFNERVLLCTEKPIICEKYKKTFSISFLDISKPKKKFYPNLNDRIEFFQGTL
ncbi:hypothetical protein G6N05_08635 [Flavobacterium sp. F372]|jgi:hypothetical protein|uniref:Uncharacterized protein n=1 Tax=Flavobacterium bernardetii TaxID=2813823 RepID=A0ABR7IXM7_9FLAO|nr:hypothetical protein [Flavobacterium bernardetii]MBC5834525.1 hypothetical protein [Flavobacterium bernardetii]NHF70173.1 hypothetical protein [Flavobacterium bernardetii]